MSPALSDSIACYLQNTWACGVGTAYVFFFPSNINFIKKGENIVRIVYYIRVRTPIFFTTRASAFGCFIGGKKNELTEIGNFYEVEPHGNLRHLPRNCSGLNSMLLKRGSHVRPLLPNPLL